LLFALALVFCFSTGVLAHLLPTVYPLTKQYLTDFLLLFLNAGLLYFLYQKNKDARLLWWALGAYLVTFGIEALGVASGNIFGQYWYEDTMKVQLLEVPVVIALNWVVLVLATNEIANKITSSKWLGALICGLLLAGYDYFIEPVAIKLDYWQWEMVDVPFQNYIAWATIAFLLALSLNYLKIRTSSNLLIVYIVSQFVFFVSLNILL